MNSPIAPRCEVKHEFHDASARDLLLESVFANADTGSVPSGYLYRAPLQGSPLLGLDGSADSYVIGQDEWEEVVDEIQRCALHTSSLTKGEIRARAEAHRAHGHVPIFVADYRVHALRNRVWVSLERQESAGATDVQMPSSDPHDLFEERQVYLASAILPSRFAAFLPMPRAHFGTNVQFIIPADGFFGGQVPSALEVDFGDGKGSRAVKVDEPVEVIYQSVGTKIVTLTAADQYGFRTAHFRVSLEPDAVAEVEQEYDVLYRAVTGRIPAPDGVARAEAMIVTSKNQPVRKPVLLVEGFPFGYAYQDLIRYANQQRFMYDLVDRGYSVALVRFTTGPMQIQTNAYAFIELLKDILSIRDGSEPLIVGGFSMGGLVARYALAYMEQPDNGQPAHQVAKFFTVDTPHEGANVSIAVQAFAQVEDPDGEQARLMRSASAQQVLLTWVREWGGGWPNGLRFEASALRQTFLEDLQRVGTMPKLPDTIAVADGGGDGQVNQADPGKFATGYSCGRKMWANLFFCPSGGLGTILVMRRRYLSDWTVYRVQTTVDNPWEAGGIDSVQGGIWEQPIFRRVYDRIPWPASRSIDHDNASFIPTASALGIRISDWRRALTHQDLVSSYFKKVTYHQPHAGQPRNEVHIRLTPQLVAFLRNHVFGIATADAADAQTPDVAPS